jgi:sugar phosphate isomerase/epimerase
MQRISILHSAFCILHFKGVCMPTLPLNIGASLTARTLADHRDWLLSGQRDVEITDPVTPGLLDGDWQPVAQRIRELLAGHTGRVGIHGPFLGLNIAAQDPKIQQIVTERLGQALDFVAAIGGSHMVLHSPFTFFGAPQVAHMGASRRSNEITMAQKIIGPVLTKAEALGCTIVIENIFDTNPTPLLELVRSFNSPLVQLSLDVGHATLTQRIGGPTPDQWVREAGTLLAHMHLQDTDGHLDRHWAPGDGNINWYALFEALAEIQHTPRIVLELRDHSHIPRGAAYLVGRGFAV